MPLDTSTRALSATWAVAMRNGRTQKSRTTLETSRMRLLVLYRLRGL
jgi:hypothetical protein